MDRIEKVAVLHNEIEAQLIDALLSEQEIPHVMRSYHDSAYDGLFQGPGAWGHVEAPRSVHDRVRELINEVRRQDQAPPGEGPGSVTERP